ncbi:MAG: SIR2 family protein [Limisphaerales bacterium]
MNKQTTSETEAIQAGLIELFDQKRRWLLFFGTGTSCALDLRLGMPKLAERLLAALPPDAQGWREIQSRLEDGQDLEQSLTGVALPASTNSLIRKEVGDHVAAIDRELRDDVLIGRKRWVGESLLKALVRRLPPVHPRLSVVTSNYDMLIEYSCAKSGLRYTSGHVGEMIRTWNLRQARDDLTRFAGASQKGKPVRAPLPRVELYKVHGSINRFLDIKTGRSFECDVWAEEAPDGFDRLVATPGDQKFESYASNIEVAAPAREAEANAMAFMVVGYGFNDAHLHNVIYERVRQNGGALLVLTRELGENRIADLRSLGKGVWILTAGKDATGRTKEEHTVVHCHLSRSPMAVKDERLWSCDCFAKRIFGV